MTRRKLWAGGAALAALLAGYAGTAVWRAVRATQTAAAHVAASRVLRFETRTLDRALPAVEQLSASAGFLDAVRFRGDLFITTPSALLEYDTGGTVRNRWRSGLELPGVPLGVLAANASTLWVATRGAGLLEFDGQAFHQVLPEDASPRKVTALLPLDTGRLLLGTAGRGVVVWDGKSLAPFHPSLAGWNVTALAGDVGSLWIGTADRGVYHWHGGALDHFAEAEGLPDPQVTSLLARCRRGLRRHPHGDRGVPRRPLRTEACGGLFHLGARPARKRTAGRKPGGRRRGDPPRTAGSSSRTAAPADARRRGAAAVSGG